MATQSKLAVILHADVVASTALVRKDELLAHDRIRAAFDNFADSVRAYKGAVSEVRGDALVAEFARASDAVLAALAAQATNDKRNATLTDDVVPEMRVGIALGEVVIADDTVTGTGVVLAQRLEQLAVPGGVCVQGSVYEAVSERLPLVYTNLGEQIVKGFDEPVRAYAAALRPGESLPAPETAAPTAGTIVRPRHHWIAGGVVAVLLVAGGMVTWTQPWKPPSDATSSPSESSLPPLDEASPSGKVTHEESGGRAALPLTDKPSIAVLAFNNMSDDPKQDYFAEGIAEDIITDLSKLSGVFVIARNSSFSYKGRAVPVGTIGRELGVQYVLEGSVRRAGDAVRINAQLIEAKTGGHVWADRYDGTLEDVFSLQDTVTEKVVLALRVSLTRAESLVLKTGDTNNADAFDAFLRGIRHLHEARRVGGTNSNAAARLAFENAVSNDGSYARAYAGLAWTYWTDAAFVFSYGGREKLENAWRLAQQSIELGDTALARQLMSKRYLDPDSLAGYRRMWGLSDDHDAAIGEGRRAVALEPNNADALAELAYVLAHAGESDEAVQLINRAKKLNPNFPAWYYKPAGIAHFLHGDYERALRELRNSYQHERIAVSGFWFASALGHVGDIEDAKTALKTVMGETRGSSQFAIARMVPLKRTQDMERFLEGLDKAGVPKEPKALN